MMQKFTAIALLTAAVFGAAEEACKEGESTCPDVVSRASGRSVLQKNQKRTIARHIATEEKINSTEKARDDKACDFYQCNRDHSAKWEKKCTRAICKDCDKCAGVQEEFDALWPPPAGGPDWAEKCWLKDTPGYIDSMADRKNILIIMVDDMNGDGGGPGAKMPNMDYLASKGVRFKKASSVNPICAPSRASIMSGLISADSKYFFGRKGDGDNPMDEKWEWYKNDVLKNSLTLMEFFRSKCYLVIGTGKLNHDELPTPVAEPYSGPASAEEGGSSYGMWDYFWAEHDYGPFAFDGENQGPHPSMPESMSTEFDSAIDFNWSPLSDVPFSDVKPDPAWVDGEYIAGGWKYTVQEFGRPTGMLEYRSSTDRDPLPDEYNAAWAIDTLKTLETENTGQPFLLMVGLVRPHTPLYCPDEYFDMFPLPVELPATIEHDFRESTHYDDVALVDGVLGYRLYRNLALAYEGEEAMGFQKWFQAYYACVAFVDAQIGKVVDYLETTSLWDKTVVAIFSDNGWNNGPKNYLYKNAPWDDGVAVPLIIRAPGAQSEGHVSYELVTLVDVYPTLMELTGFSPTDEDTRKNDKGHRLSGKSLATALLGETSSAYDYSFAQIYPSQNKKILEFPHCNDDSTCCHLTVRNRTMRYILYNTGVEELYYYGEDQQKGYGESFEAELTNLADLPEYAGAKADFKQYLASMESIAPYKDNLGSWSTGLTQPYDNCCQKYCSTSKKDWDAKCKWDNCNMCNECPSPSETCWDEATNVYVPQGSLTDVVVPTPSVEPLPTPEPTNYEGDGCKGWCYTSSDNTEEELCGWSSCKKCSFC